MAQFELKEDDKDLELDDLLIAGDDEPKSGKKLVILGAVGVLLFAVVLVAVYFIQNSQSDEQLEASDRAKEEIAQTQAPTPEVEADKAPSASAENNTDEQFQRIINQIKAQQQENNATLSKGAENLATDTAALAQNMPQKPVEPQIQEIKPLPEPVAKVEPKAQNTQKAEPKKTENKKVENKKVEPKAASAAPAVAKNATQTKNTPKVEPKKVEPKPIAPAQPVAPAPQVAQNTPKVEPKPIAPVVQPAPAANIAPAANAAPKPQNAQTYANNANQNAQRADDTPAPKINPAGVGFYVQVASFVRLEPDKNLLKSLNASGYSYRSWRVGDTNRLLVGPFSSRQEAQDNLGQIRDKFSKEAFVREVQ